MEDVERTEKQWSEKGQAVVDAVQEAAQAEGIKAKAVVVRSDLVAESIIAAVKKHKCDLVVMASHGRKGIKRVLLGSETQHVLTHSTVPVLVLR
jgi:nucleotide-binding universal stress UspA family protein